MDKELFKDLKKYLRKSWGKRCKNFHYACPVCQVYMAYDILLDACEFERIEHETRKI